MSLTHLAARLEEPPGMLRDRTQRTTRKMNTVNAKHRDLRGNTGGAISGMIGISCHLGRAAMAARKNYRSISPCYYQHRITDLPDAISARSN